MHMKKECVYTINSTFSSWTNSRLNMSLVIENKICVVYYNLSHFG